MGRHRRLGGSVAPNCTPLDPPLVSVDFQWNKELSGCFPRFSGFYEYFHGFRADFQGVFPDFRLIKTFGYALAPLRPRLRHHWFELHERFLYGSE